MEMSGHLDAPASLPSGKDSRYPLDRRLVGPESRSGRCGEKFALVSNRIAVVQPVACLYTD
jgi:hypothetical protein